MAIMLQYMIILRCLIQLHLNVMHLMSQMFQWIILNLLIRIIHQIFGTHITIHNIMELYII